MGFNMVIKKTKTWCPYLSVETHHIRLLWFKSDTGWIFALWGHRHPKYMYSFVSPVMISFAVKIYYSLNCSEIRAVGKWCWYSQTTNVAHLLPSCCQYAIWSRMLLIFGNLGNVSPFHSSIITLHTVMDGYKIWLEYLLLNNVPTSSSINLNIEVVVLVTKKPISPSKMSFLDNLLINANAIALPLSMLKPNENVSILLN